MSKKVENNEKKSYIAEKGQNWWKIRKRIFFGFFSGKYGKMSTKVKNDEKSHILLKRAKIDEK